MIPSHKVSLYEKSLIKLLNGNIKPKILQLALGENQLSLFLPCCLEKGHIILKQLIVVTNSPEINVTHQRV
jgi:hypothetical protein